MTEFVFHCKSKIIQMTNDESESKKISLLPILEYQHKGDCGIDINNHNTCGNNMKQLLLFSFFLYDDE